MHFRFVALVVFGVSVTPAQAGEDGAVQFDAISLQRSGCYGACPEYSVTVHADGKVEYNGLRNVPSVGPRTSTISGADVQFLALAIERVPLSGFRRKYRNAADGCTELWTDNPTTTITLRQHGESTTVEYYQGCLGAPEFQRFLWLADTVDEVASVLHPLTVSEDAEP